MLYCFERQEVVSWKREEWGVKLCFRCFWRVIVCVWWRDRRARRRPTLPDAQILALHIQQLEIGAFTMTSGAYKWPKLRSHECTYIYIHAWTDASIQTEEQQRLSQNFKSAPPQAIQDQDEFVSSSGLEKCVSAMDALQWMGAVRMRANGCSAVNGCRQNESQWMLCSEWVPSEWEIKNVLMLDLFHLLSSPDVNWWTGVLWIIVMFLSDSHSDGTHSLQSIHWLSFWRHPFTAEHPLALILTAPIHCRASIAETLMQSHISTNLMKKQTHPDLGRLHFQAEPILPIRRIYTA